MLNAQIATTQEIPLSISKSTDESLFFRLNTTTVLTGETLYYNLFCFHPKDNSSSQISKIAYVELIDSNKQSVFKDKILLEHGKGYGDYFIPTTLKTGNYKLIAYTQWMLNKANTPFYETDINLINPFIPNESGTKVIRDLNLETPQVPIIASASEKHSGLEKPIALEFEKKMYTHREQVNLKIKMPLQDAKIANYSVSIRKRDQLYAPKQLNSAEFISKQTEESFQNTPKTSVNFLPELRGEFISGKIVSTKGIQEVNNQAVALSIPGKPFIFKLVKTNAKGEFKFILDQLSDNENAVLQIMGDNKENFTFVLDEAIKPNLSKLNFSSAFSLNSKDKKTIEERSVAAQLQNAYYAQKKDTIQHSLNSEIFLGSIAKEYILDDYTRFPSLKETITEVLLECHSKRKNNKSMIYLSNDKVNLDNFGNPLVLVDGLLVQDTNELFEYTTTDIHKVSLINEGYVYGSKTFGGVISFETKSGNFESKDTGNYIKKINLQAPSYGKKYNSPDYINKKLDRIPDYRYQLLWIPDVTMENDEKTITFFTSDISGEFEVSIEGFTDKGVPLSLKDFFEVN